MADCLVQQHTGPARAEHHRQAAGRCRLRLEIDQCLAQRFARIAHRAVLAEEILITQPSAAALTAPLAATVLFDDHADVETHQRPDIGRHAAIHTGNQNVFPDAGQTHRNLLDARVERSRGDIDALEQLDLFRPAQPVQWIILAVQRRKGRPRQHLHAALLAATGNRTSCLRRLAQRLGGDRIAVGEAGLLAGQRANTNALLQVEAALLDDAILQHPGLADLVLKIQIGRVDTRPGEFRQQHRQVINAQAAGGQKPLDGGQQQFTHSHSKLAVTRHGTSNRRWPVSGMRWRMANCSAASRRAVNAASPSACSHRMRPQGSTIDE